MCREALYSLITPGHLLSPHLFLNYRHLIEYILYVKHIDSISRNSLTILWRDTFRINWGPFFRLRNAAKSFDITIEDPFIFIIQDVAYSIDEPLDQLKHLIRASYRQHLLKQASHRRQECHGISHPIDISLTRSLYLSQTKPLLQTLLRQILTGSVDHAQRLFKSNLVPSPLCPFCNLVDETSKHIFWECSHWSFVRQDYPRLVRLYRFLGSQWPNCFLHCGWIESNKNYGLQILEGLGTPYDFATFVQDTHNMYLHVLLARHDAAKVLRSTPQTPPLLTQASLFPSSVSPIQIPDDVSPISVQSSRSS